MLTKEFKSKLTNEQIAAFNVLDAVKALNPSILTDKIPAVSFTVDISSSEVTPPTAEDLAKDPNAPTLYGFMYSAVSDRIEGDSFYY